MKILIQIFFFFVNMVECLNNVDIHLLECIGDELFVGQRHRLYIKYIYFYSLWAKTKLSTKVTAVGGSNPAIPHVIEVGGDNQSFQGVIGEIQQQVLHKVEVSAVQLLWNQEPSQPSPSLEEAEPPEIKEEQLELSVNPEADELEARQENGIFLVFQFKPCSEEQLEVNENRLIQNEDEMNHQHPLQGITQEIQIQLHRTDLQQHLCKDDLSTYGQFLNSEVNYDRNQEEPEPQQIKDEESEPSQIKDEEPEPSQIKDEESEPSQIKEEEPEPPQIKEEEPELPQIQGKHVESSHIAKEPNVDKRKGEIISEPHLLDLTLQPVIKLHRIGM
ncbi:involucrin isoform X3 [Oryzias melastigma]|uniref:involucrin isoform X3 n=1 Tax=Oryzias melastigma TaxID=30732 RepID=UPI00168CEA8F|nr:involucrin isoform X3 [Oryzias melastigma]